MAEKQDRFQISIDQIQHQFGEDAIMKMGSSGLKVDFIPTGSILLDRAIGVGGIPRGRIIEIFGPESGGKTTLALHILAQAQKYGNTAFIDAEHALDIEYARKIGINVDNLWISQPDSGEQALEIVDALVRSNDCALIVIDSVAALTPKAELEGEMGDSHMGLQARLMSQALRKLTGIVSKSNCSVIFINQLRMKIGVVYGNPEVTTGGNALKFYASLRLDIRKIDKIKSGEDIIGNKIRIKVVKNKVAPPFRECETVLIFGKGISYASEVADILISNGTIEKAGGWFKYKEDKIQGKDNLVAFVEKHMLTLKKLI
jgi:recombination protein RecA